MTIPQDGIRDALIRITKGLMYENARDVDRNSLLYKVIPIDQFRLNEMIDPIVPLLKWKGERGDGAFRYWGGQVEEDQNGGIWILMFFDSAAFAVFHEPKERTGRSNKKNAAYG